MVSNSNLSSFNFPKKTKLLTQVFLYLLLHSPSKLIGCFINGYFIFTYILTMYFMDFGSHVYKQSLLIYYCENVNNSILENLIIKLKNYKWNRTNPYKRTNKNKTIKVVGEVVRMGAGSYPKQNRAWDILSCVQWPYHWPKRTDLHKTSQNKIQFFLAYDLTNIR